MIIEVKESALVNDLFVKAFKNHAKLPVRIGVLGWKKQYSTSGGVDERIIELLPKYLLLVSLFGLCVSHASNSAAF